MTAKYVQYGRLRYKILRFKDGRVRLEIVKRGMLDIAEIIGLNEQIELNDLDLSHNKIKNFNGLENLVNLRILRLSSNQISEISGLEHLVNLEELYLDENQIKEINGLENLTNLRVLDLSYNEITDDKAIEELKANLPNLNSIQLGGNPCTLDIASLNQDRFLFKKTLEMRNSLSDSEFFDILGEVFKSNPEDYMKNLYGEVRKTVKKLYGDEKLNEMERYIIEKFCLYEDEQILYELKGNIKQTELLEQKASGKYKMDTLPLKISVKSADIFITNKRMIGHGVLKASGGEKTKGAVFYLTSLWVFTGGSKKAERNKALIESSPVFGYQFPIKNHTGLGKNKLLHIVAYYVNIDKLKCIISIKPTDKAKREEQMSKIFEILRKDANEVLDVINEANETIILEKNKRRYILDILKGLRKSEEFADLSDLDFLDIVKETYKLDPEFFMKSIYPKMKSWDFPSFLSIKEELIELIENLNKETG